MRAFHASRVSLLLLTMCGEPEAPSVVEEPTSPRPSSPEAPAAEPPGDEEESLATEPAFDFRRVRTEPDAHQGQERPCDVGFADDAHTLEPTERGLYSESTVARRSIRCEALSGGGWLEVTFDDPSDASQVVAGRRVVLRPEEPSGGRHGYVVARFVRSLGAGEPTPVAADEPRPAREIRSGFDFGRLANEPARARSTQTCVVDFVGDVEIVDSRTRARSGYPDETQNRLNVKCLHEAGDSWIDLVFERGAGDAALSVAPGSTLTVQVIAPSGGFANRPVTQIVEGT